MNRFISILQRERRNALTRGLACHETFSPGDPLKLESARLRLPCNCVYLCTVIESIDLLAFGRAKVRPQAEFPSVEG
jgi:hypothetical protein